MGKPVVVRFVIPVFGEDKLSEREPLVFHRWLPVKDDEALTVRQGDLELRFWIDAQCLTSLRETDLDDLGHCINIDVGKMIVDVKGLEVSVALGDVIMRLAKETNFTEEHIAANYDPAMLNEYGLLGKKTYSAVISNYNRLIAYVRAVKGQYWLREYESWPTVLHSEFNRLRAKIQVEGSDWARFTTTGTDVIMADMRVDEERLIKKADWEGIQNHLAGQRKAPLVGQLLAAADHFCELGHGRAALTEAVSALEVAVTQFYQHASPEKWPGLFAERSGVENIRQHCEHLGTTCTVSYLFPLLFTENQMPNSVLKSCREAIEERNVVIHKGQRDIDEIKLRRYLRSIRDLCDRLTAFNRLPTTSEHSAD